MQIHYGPGSSILCGSRATAGTLITVPAGKVWCGDVMLQACVAAAATGSPTVTVQGAGAAPDAGTVVHRLSLTGLSVSAVAAGVPVSVVVRAPAENAITLELAGGNATAFAAVANGVLL